MNYDKSTILLVDDRPANILALEHMLEKQGRTFLRAASGDEALKYALNRQIDLIILDVQMPAMDGFEVSQILKSNYRTKEIPIIFASAEKKEHQSIMKGFEEGAVDYLFKPLDPEITRAKVAVLLKLQMQKKELIDKNASLERSALLINNSADIIGVIDINTMKFEEVNQAFTTILGYGLDEIEGTAVEFFLSDEDRNFVRSLKTKGKERMSFETRVYCKDRSIKWLQWNVVVKDGKWFINTRDITLVKQVEKIRDSLATIVKQSNDAIYIHDESGRVITWNKGAEEIYGYTEDEALRMKIWNIIPEHLHAETQQIIDTVQSGSGLLTLETKRITKHGKIVDVLFSSALIAERGSMEKSFSITERDITQQKIAAEQIMQLNKDLKDNVLQLESTNKELESFSYSISHDLRSPLRSLMGYSQILGEDYEEKFDAEGKRLLSVITRNALKMNALIDDLLEFSRLGKKELGRTEINMSEIVDQVIQEAKTVVKHEVDFNVDALPSAQGDQSLITQVWTNLISNAIKYSGKKSDPKVNIGAYTDNGNTVYFVKDNGAGFEMAYADKLFGVFQRLHKKEEFDGTGIGLAIIHRVITRHGGKVWAEGKVNEGAAFYFSLPNLK
ncbi:MAG TPA: PAS domain S-box protein [Cyclobacteriaceae bacterium]|nr:PAS domain S-box protein [Cyclobacteriaceae bacterium]